MKFKLTTYGQTYSQEQAKKLKQLGFEFFINKYDTMLLEKMPRKSVEIEFNTLDELIEFSKKWGEIIVSGAEIEIYDIFRE